MKDSKSIVKDKGYAWVVCFCCSLSQAISNGVVLSFGVLMPKIQRNLGSDTGSTAFFGSLQLCVTLLTAQLHMSLIKQYGVFKMEMIAVSMFAMGILVCGLTITPTVFVVFYCILSGIGMGMKSAAEKLVVNLYFDKKRALANSIFYCGSPIVSIITLPLLTRVAENYGLQAAFLIQFGTAVFNAIIIYCALYEMPEDEFEPITERITLQWYAFKVRTIVQSTFHHEVMSNKGLIFFIIGRVLCSAMIQVPQFYLPTALQQNRHTPTESAIAIAIIEILRLFGRILTGSFGDKLSDHCLIISAGLNLGCATAVLIMMFTLQSSLVYVYLACGLYGLFSGPKVLLSPSCLASIVGTEYYQFICAYGLNICAYAFGVIFGVPLLGHVIDHFGGFDVAFSITVVLYCLSALLHYICELILMSKKMTQHQQYQPIPSAQ